MKINLKDVSHSHVSGMKEFKDSFNSISMGLDSFVWFELPCRIGNGNRVKAYFN